MPFRSVRQRKAVMSKLRGVFTTRRGRTRSRSAKQHRLLHHIRADHTHRIGQRRIRHRWVDGRFVREAQ